MERTERRGLNAFAVALLLVMLPLVGWTLCCDAASAPRAENPHGAFKEECAHCHTAASWKISRVSTSFDHSRYGFPLAGAHASVACTACHKSLDFTQAKTQCILCHQDPHRGEMGTDCARCHGSRSFVDRGPMVRAHQLTRFPLTGSHTAIDCESCHKGSEQGHMRFIGTQAECKGCHLPLYEAAKSPDHVAGDFPQECQACHATVAWSPARFNHNASGFPLTGAHRAVTCQMCHADGVYAGKPTACQSCHMTDYNTANPNHAAAGFSASACATCHTTTQWAGATIDHDGSFFPIYSGAHLGEWTTCQTCHTNSNNYVVFTCLSCHPHDDKTVTDGHHSSVSGYSYDSAACFRCHPRGRVG